MAVKAAIAQSTVERKERTQGRLRPRVVSFLCAQIYAPRTAIIATDEMKSRQVRISPLVCALSSGTLLFRFVEELCPVGRDTFLSVSQCHLAVSYLFSEEVLDRVLPLEEPLRQCDMRWTALRPNVVESVSPAEFERNQVIEFA